MKSILLITSSYPFGKGEPFLGNELKLIQKEGILPEIFPYYFGQQKECRLDHPKSIPFQKPMVQERGKKRWFKALQGFLKVFPQALKDMVQQKPIHIQKISKFLIANVNLSCALQSKEFAKLCQKINKESVLYFYWGDHAVALIPHIKKKFPQVRVVIRLHGSDLFERTPHSYFPYRPQIFEWADALVSISKAGQKELCQRFPQHQAKIHHCGLGVTPAPLPTFKDDPSIPLNLVSCSNLIPLKRVHRIIEVLHKLEFPVKWVHFGDGPLRFLLESQANDLDQSLVHWEFRGQVSNEFLREYYANHAIHGLLNVSESEGIPVSLMEACAAGIPIIATDVGGTAELMGSQSAWLLPKEFSNSQLIQLISKLQKIKNSGNFGSFRQEWVNIWAESFDAKQKIMLFYQEHLLYL